VRYELLVGLRYTRAKRRNHFISFISLISMAGIALGVMALIVVLSVMNGFQTEVRTRILGVASHVQVTGASGELDDWPSVARRAAAHPKVVRVHYPGLLSHPQHALARQQMCGFGGLISLELGSLDKARTLLEGVRLMSLAESLGGVETLISHPATMTHASVPPDRRQAIGVTDDLVRISVGIEDVEDLRDDLTQALDLL